MSAYPNCSICFDLFEELANIAACACGHTFHHHCIVDWAKKCQTEGQPSLCPTCKKRFETNAARGVIKKLYFTFDASSSRLSSTIDKDSQRKLKEQIEIAETLLCEAESRDAEISALRRKLELTETLLKSCEGTKSAEIVELEDKLKLSEAMLMSAREENVSLKRKADVFQEIVNLVTGAGLTGDNVVIPPIPPRQPSPYHPLKQNTLSAEEWVQVGNVNSGKKKKKKKKIDPEAASESPVDTIVFLGPENEQVAAYSNAEEDDNFLMPAPKLKTLNKFETLHGTGEELSFQYEASHERQRPSKSNKSDDNNNTKHNNVKSKSQTNGLDEEASRISASGAVAAAAMATSPEIFYSDEEEDNAFDPGLLEQKFEAAFQREKLSGKDRKLFEAPFTVNVNMKYPLSRQVLLERVPPYYKYRDLKNLFPFMVDFKIEEVGDVKDDYGRSLTRAIITFFTFNDAREALKRGEVFTKNDDSIWIKNLNHLNQMPSQTDEDGKSKSASPCHPLKRDMSLTKAKPEANGKDEKAATKEAEKEAPRKSSIDCSPIVITRPVVPPINPHNAYRFPMRPQLQPYQRPGFRIQGPGVPYGYMPHYGRGRYPGPWY